MIFRVYPYKQGSRSAKELANALGGKVLRLEGSKYRPKKDDVVVNWGSSFNMVTMFPHTRCLNPVVSSAQCKLETFKVFNKGDDSIVDVPPWAVTKDGAKCLGFPVLCRTKLRGHSGEGIVIANNEDELVDAPLYVKYIKKKDEYRVHVTGNDAFFIQRKAKKNDTENPNWMIRNLAGGFAFVEEAFENVPEQVIKQSIIAIKALGLDFGGVDVIWNDKQQRAYVLEVNTACGLEPRTAERYANAIRSFIEG